MSLYEVTGRYAGFIEQFGEIDPDNPDYEALAQAQLDTLDALSGEFDQNAEDIACLVKNLRAEADAIKNEERALAVRRKQGEKLADRLSDYLLRCMDEVGETKIHGIRASLAIRKNPPSVRITDVDALLYDGSEYVKPRRLKEEDLDKAKIKNALKSGTCVEGAELVQDRSLTIR